MCIARTETFWVGLWSRSAGTMPLLAEAGPLLYNPFRHARIRWSQEDMQQVGYCRLGGLAQARQAERTPRFNTRPSLPIDLPLGQRIGRLTAAGLPARRGTLMLPSARPTPSAAQQSTIPQTSGRVILSKDARTQIIISGSMRK